MCDWLDLVYVFNDSWQDVDADGRSIRAGGFVTYSRKRWEEVQRDFPAVREMVEEDALRVLYPWDDNGELVRRLDINPERHRAWLKQMGRT